METTARQYKVPNLVYAHVHWATWTLSCPPSTCGQTDQKYSRTTRNGPWNWYELLCDTCVVICSTHLCTFIPHQQLNIYRNHVCTPGHYLQEMPMHMLCHPDVLELQQNVRVLRKVKQTSSGGTRFFYTTGYLSSAG